jgi:glycine cleavage system H protein
VTPNDLKFTSTHEWVRVEKDAAGKKIATLGITAFALKALTDLVFIELPPLGRKVQAGQPFGEVESVKAVSDLYSPVDGEVVDVNPAVADNLEHLSDDPYGAGWLIKIAVRDDAPLAQLMDEAAYRKQCEEEG